MKLTNAQMIVLLIAGAAIIIYLFKKKEGSKSESSSFRGGRGFGGLHHRFYPGSGGWLGWGYPVPYGYYDVYDPIAVTTTDCPKGWIWMGAMLGCQKPQGI